VDACRNDILPSIYDLRRVLTALEELVGAPAGSLQGTQKLEDLEQWDSVSMVNFLALAEEKCGIQLEPRQLTACTTVDDLFRLTQKA
jgi:acyl carrier protein